jgi:signal transduction histidine kinase
VIDGGIGFEAGAEERIFSPFVQADATVTQKFGGLGLGLAIAKATVDGHGGKLIASSDGPGRGARFAVELPLVSSLEETS